MRNRAAAVVILVLFAGVGGAFAEQFAGLPLHTESLGERGIRLWLGDTVSTTAVTALATSRGIVVIDTTDFAGLDAYYRRIIARELGREDFAVLINTHEHGDHTLGNHVYTDCQIVAHERAVEGMRRRMHDVPRMLEWYRENLPKLEQEIADAGPEVETLALRERALASSARRARLEQGVEPTLPTITFSDRLTLDMGDTTLELSYAGGVHTASDIFVFVPEQGLLFTGDTMADIWHTESAGCLATFMIRRDVHHDFPLLLANWAELIGRRDEIRDLIPGHWNGDLTFAGFENRYTYVKTLWEEVRQAVADGVELDDLFARFDLEQRFPELVDSPGITPRSHAGSILGMWCEVTGTESAADHLRTRAEEVGVEQAAAEVKAARDGDRFYFLEYELNLLGYRYLGQEQVDEAKTVFELNVELYPESWNVYDSLAEATMAGGDLERAVELYRRSLELNPDNDNGRTMLERIAAQS
jgi:glyoxylase-like metal-dependent hydrolase (beta-lactamase superfamily II)